MQRFKIIGFMAIEVRFIKKRRRRRWKTWTKCGIHIFKYYVHITSQHNKLSIQTAKFNGLKLRTVVHYYSVRDSKLCEVFLTAE